MEKRGGRTKINPKANKEDTSKRIILDITTRYLLLMLLAIGNLPVFYIIFTPLTAYPVVFLFKLFFNVYIWEQTIFVENNIILLVESCIAGAAYYFLLILNLTTRGINTMKRIKIFLFTSSLFLILNIARIFLLGALLVNNNTYFDITHRFSWYIISTLFVVLVWLLTIKIFKIQEIPFYSDFMFLRKQIKRK